MDSFSTTADSGSSHFFHPQKTSWLGAVRRECLETLEREIAAANGLQLLVGGEGVGKTFLVGQLREKLDDTIVFCRLSRLQGELLDLYNEIGEGLGLGGEYTSRVQFLLDFTLFLRRAADQGRKVLLVVDDGHTAGPPMFELLRSLSNVTKDGGRIIGLLLVGRPELEEMIDLPENRALRRRFAARIAVAPLDKAETGQYLCCRLKQEWDVEARISDGALVFIHRWGGGIFSEIDELCALIAGRCTVQGEVLIDEKLMRSCLAKDSGDRNTAQEKGAKDGSTASDAAAGGTWKKYRTVAAAALLLFVLALLYAVPGTKKKEEMAAVELLPVKAQQEEPTPGEGGAGSEEAAGLSADSAEGGPEQVVAQVSDQSQVLQEPATGPVTTIVIRDLEVR
ncbi:ExeA family protein [Desulforhopalus singaporensis]|nr:ATP-binding protein [Desulforhopalus singaporensis]